MLGDNYVLFTPCVYFSFSIWRHYHKNSSYEDIPHEEELTIQPFLS
jgi:hypothetical protein